MRTLTLVLCLALAVVACDRSERSSTQPQTPPVSAPAPAPAAAAQVKSIELGNQLGSDGRVTAATTAFGPSDTIYVSILTDTAGHAGSTLSARWTYEDGQLVSESRETLGSSPRNATEFHIQKPDGFPAGRYRVDIALNGQPAGSRDFVVQ